MRMDRRIVEIRSAIDDECAICLETMRNRRVVHSACGHAMHLTCERRLRRSCCPNKHRCPICRESTSDEADVPELLTAEVQAILDMVLWD